MALNATGAIGEVIAQIILLKAYDNVKIRQRQQREFSTAINVQAFLI